jgi:hypothetical protein
MSGSLSGTRAGRSAIAMAKDGNELKAVELRKHGELVEVLWTKSSKSNNWRLFAAECGLSAETMRKPKAAGDKMSVVGYESTGVAFYRIEVPAVGQQETDAIVRMQAETLLPLPLDEMELAWRTGRTVDKKVAVTIAAARREQLQRFLEKARALQPARLLLDCEALVKVWTTLFSGSEPDAAVLSLAAQNTQICLVQDGRLSDAVVLDVGIEDFPELIPSLPASADSAGLEQSATTDRLIQDVRSALESFGYTEPAELPLIVLSDDGRAVEGVVACLNLAGMNARRVLPDLEKLSAQKELSVAQIYEYRVPIGLGLMGLEKPAEGFDLFERLYSPAGMAKKKSRLYSPKIAAAVAAITLVVLVAVSYALDVASQKRLSELEARPDFKELVQRQKLVKTVAQQRPDLLELLSEINSGENKGILLDVLHFKKGQPITIRGQAENEEQMTKFQEGLTNKKGIKNPLIQNPTRDDKTKKIKFTLTIDYKNFTKKTGPPRRMSLHD